MHALQKKEKGNTVTDTDTWLPDFWRYSLCTTICEYITLFGFSSVSESVPPSVSVSVDVNVSTSLALSISVSVSVEVDGDVDVSLPPS